MPLKRSIAFLGALLCALAMAQGPQLRGPLVDVLVEGTQSYADSVRVIVSARAGTPVERIDLEAERNRIYGLGAFREVSVSLEDRGQGPVLVIRVVENPPIGAISFEGVSALAEEGLRALLADANLLEPGRVYNITRAEEATGTLQRAYRQQGFPFDPAIALTVEPMEAAEGERPPVRLHFAVTETEVLEAVRFEPSSLLTEDDLGALFQALELLGEFDFPTYRAAAQEVGRRYEEAGFRGSSVDLEATQLANRVLTVRFRELRIAGIDTTAIGVNPDALSLKPGDLYNYDVLLEDVRRLARGRSGDIRLVPLTTRSGEVRVSFQLGPPDTAGPIDEVRIEGNTVVSTAELLELFELRIGDTFTSTLAEEDFRRIRELYTGRGYLIDIRPAFNYLDGTYLQRIQELRIAGYQVVFDGGREGTQDFVVLRYLPAVGGVANDNEVIGALREVARLGAVEPLGRRYLPTEQAGEVVVEVIVRETATGQFTPSAQYATDTGFSANVSFSEINFLGRAHSFSAEIDGQSTDIGLMFGGNVRYTIPWIYLDVLDFLEVPTSVSASVFSNVRGNQLLTADGTTRVTYPGAADREENLVLVGEYTQRDTGLSFSVGRPVAPYTSIRVAGRGSIAEYWLEPPTPCDLDENGNVIDPDTCSLPADLALTYLPQGGLSSFVSTTVSYDDRDDPEFPRSGIASFGLFGVGLGTDFRSPETGLQQAYNYQQVEFGVKTYLLLRDLVPEEIDDPNHVLAFRVNVGHQFGGAYPASKYFRVGSTSAEATQIRGYTVSDLNLSQTYLTSSVEYRYDFGFSSFATQTIIGIVFVDLGWVSSVPGFELYRTPFLASAGIGIQVNLGFSGVRLPALRFDYAFSQRNPTGVFAFRIGPVF